MYAARQFVPLRYVLHRYAFRVHAVKEDVRIFFGVSSLLKTRAKKLYRTRTRIFGRLNRIRILCKINGSIASAHRSPAKKRVQDLVRVF